MRKVMFLIAVLLMAVPAMAASDVVVTATDDDVDSVTISFASDVNLIRAFGLNIEVNDANIISVEVLDENYRIYPSQIEIDGGEVTAYNAPYDPCDLGDANLAIEMGSLYTDDANYEEDPNAGYGMQPGLIGNLLKFTVDSTPCTYTVTENTITGGVVMEDPCEPANVTITLVDGTITGEVPKCMTEANPAYADWVSFGEPNCWCYQYQCNGDADGKKQLVFWVYTNDLSILKSAYAKPGTPPNNGICADFDHKKQLVFRVYTNDLAILKSYYAKPSVPSCGTPPDTNYNFWETP